MTIEVADFQQQVIEASRSGPVLVDFWAPWCGPCREIGPILERLSDEAQGAWTLAKVNVDMNPAVAQTYRVSSIPAVKLFVDGEVADEFLGAIPETQVRDWLANAMPSALGELLVQAQLAMEMGNDGGALELLDQVLAEEPANATARVLQAKLLLFTDAARAIELAQGVDSKDVEVYKLRDAVLTLARLLEQRDAKAELASQPGGVEYVAAIDALVWQDYESALTKLLHVVRLNRQLDDDGARRACIALFALVGEHDPRVHRFVRQLQMALF